MEIPEFVDGPGFEIRVRRSRCRPRSSRVAIFVSFGSSRLQAPLRAWSREGGLGGCERNESVRRQAPRMGSRKSRIGIRSSGMLHGRDARATWRWQHRERVGFRERAAWIATAFDPRDDGGRDIIAIDNRSPCPCSYDSRFSIPGFTGPRDDGGRGIIAIDNRSPCRLLSASCSSGQRFAFGFLQIRSHPRHPCRSANSSPCRASRGLPPPSECALQSAQ